MNAGGGSGTILFAGGGTGGHLFPALAVAEQVLERNPSTRVRFLCSNRPLDASILTEERLAGKPVDYAVIPAKPFVLRPFAFLRFIRSWGGAVRAGRRAIQEAKQHGHVWVVAGGGFVAAPVVQAARVERVPVLMLNLDAAPGRANRWISKHAKKVVTTTAVPGVPWELIPPIVRAVAIAPGSPEVCREKLGLDPLRPTIFVTGASQGAKSINTMMGQLAKDHAKELQSGRWQIIHQTGSTDNTALESDYAAAGIRALVFGFRKDLGICWGAANLAISRAGAGNVAEAWANRVPTVFMPYPYHKDEHQKKNAEPLVAAGGAVLAKDLIETGANVAEVAPVVMALVRDAAKLDAMRAALVTLGHADGAARVANILLRA